MKEDSPEYKPIEAVCKACGLRIDVTAKDRAWPVCPHCHEPMVRVESTNAGGKP